jgi:3-deoxy-D-manno-octulosonate 8-phosphate phosphatase KdsC-like HAD superfamily phosphatase
VNGCVPKFATEAALGDTLTELEAIAVVTVTVADPDFEPSFCEVAVTVTWGGFGTVAGAV